MNDTKVKQVGKTNWADFGKKAEEDTVLVWQRRILTSFSLLSLLFIFIFPFSLLFLCIYLLAFKWFYIIILFSLSSCIFLFSSFLIALNHSFCLANLQLICLFFIIISLLLWFPFHYLDFYYFLCCFLAPIVLTLSSPS